GPIDEIHRFSATGADLGTFVSLDYVPSGIAFDDVGNLYVLDLFDDLVHRYSPTGTDLGIFARTEAGSHAFFLRFSPPPSEAVPEPGTLAMWSLGSFGLSISVWLHRHRGGWARRDGHPA